MTNFFYAKEIKRPEDLVPCLAKKELHWKPGYSAYELAHSWGLSSGIPRRVQDLLESCPAYRGAKLVEGFFERDVDLRSPGRRSQTDLLALASVPNGYAVLAVEGKAEEPFGRLVSEWLDGSNGKAYRLNSLCTTLGLQPAHCGTLRYQLFHRTVSAIYEAQRYCCNQALVLVHSFSATKTSFADFSAFTEAMGAVVAKPDSVSPEIKRGEVKLRFAWCADQIYG